jgi:L-fucose isomerase-like protein
MAIATVVPRVTLGVIIGNRDFFPDHLVSEAGQDVAEVFRELDVDAVMLGEHESKLGGVETYADAQKCAALFRSKSGQIDGVLVVLPNFGHEKGVADTLKLS